MNMDTMVKNEKNIIFFCVLFSWCTHCATHKLYSFPILWLLPFDYYACFFVARYRSQKSKRRIYKMWKMTIIIALLLVTTKSQPYRSKNKLQCILFYNSFQVLFSYSTRFRRKNIIFNYSYMTADVLLSSEKYLTGDTCTNMWRHDFFAY